jgi:hypothetical protein
MFSFRLQIREPCLSFLRMASILRNHIYGDPLPEVFDADDESNCLLTYLSVVDGVSLIESRFVKMWFAELKLYAGGINGTSALARNLRGFDLNVSYRQPMLLPLPYEYRDVFQVGQS